MLAKRITTPTVFSGALALAALSGCSLQDYDALGAGNKTDERTEDTDESTTDSDSSDAPTTTSSDSTNEPDASATTDTDTDTSDTSATEPTSTETSSSSTTSDTPSTSDSVSTTETSDTTTDDTTSEPTPPPPAIVTEGNLIANSSFEEPVSIGAQPGRWQIIGSAAAAVATEMPHSGTRCWQTGGRTMSWEGPGINMLGILEHDQSYVGRAWVRATAASSFGFLMKSICVFEGGVEVEDDTTIPLIYQHLGATFSSGTEWVLIETSPFQLRDCELNTLVLYFDGPAPGVGLYLDDVSVVPVAE